jgi:hypothetical protein
MNYKPDENTLIAYLYGELDGKEQEKLAQYFQEHPEELKHIQALSQARDLIGAVNDKEVIAPPVFSDGYSHGRPLWQSAPVRWVAGMAASFLFLMVAARLIGMEIYYSQGELRISFAKKQEVPVQSDAVSRLTVDQVQTMIRSSLVENNEFIAARWADNQRMLDESVRRRLDLNSKKTEDMMKNASLASQEQIRSFVDGLQDENLRSMKDYLQLSSTEQKKYVENLLVDFSKYLQEQRNQDLTLFQTRMSSMERNTDQFKQETEQILSGIISSSGVKKENNY